MISKQVEDITLLMKYAVPEADRTQADKVLETYANDRIALNLLHEFYSFLPEGLDDAVKELLLIERSEGLFLLIAVTGIDAYLYLVNQEKAEFLGPCAEGIWEEEVQEHFGYASREESISKLKDPSVFPAYRPAHDNRQLCPVCTAAAGEFHTLGCPAEICPWCQGQLTRCNCRYTITGKTAMHDEEDLEEFIEQLEAKGRIPFDPRSQRPGYPGASSSDD